MKIAFYSDSPYDWNDLDLETNGVGGSQLSLIHITRELAKNHDVTVFNNTSLPGRYHQVCYRNYHSFEHEEDWDVFISFRCPLPLNVNARCKIHWCVDPGDVSVEKDHGFADKIITISPFHTKMIQNIFHIHPDQIYESRLGVDENEYKEDLPKQPHKLIFCSAPERGIIHIPRIFTLVQKEIPDVTMVITMDYRLWGFNPDIHQFKRLFDGIKGVNYLGKVSRQRLLQEQKTSALHIYPCDGPYEMFCLASMECQAAGTPTVATRQGALTTTVDHRSSGLLIDSLPHHDPDFHQTFADHVIDLLKNPDALSELARSARDRALSHFTISSLTDDWEKRFKDWIQND